MSSYGPQGGPYPGQPQDPWQDGSADDPYRSGYPDPVTDTSYGRGAYNQPTGYGQYGGRPGPAAGAMPGSGSGSVTGEVWGPPQAPARPGRPGTAIGVIIVVVLLAIGGASAAAFFLTRGDGEPTATPPSATPSSSQAPSSAAPSASERNADAKVAKQGDCLLNKGSADKPDMQKVACGANSYQVLKRIDGTSDKEKCQGTPNLTDWYFFDHSDDAQDFVLCLRKR